MKPFIEMTIKERQIHNDYINCIKEYPRNILLSRDKEIERDKLILKRSVSYYKASLK